MPETPNINHQAGKIMAILVGLSVKCHFLEDPDSSNIPKVHLAKKIFLVLPAYGAQLTFSHKIYSTEKKSSILLSFFQK